MSTTRPDIEPMDLEHYFDHSRRNLPVTRKELKEIIAYFITKGSFAQSLEVFYDELEQEMKKEIERRVQEEMGAFMLSLQSGEKVEDSGIITLAK